MKKCSIIALCLTLCACFGGGSKGISQQTPATPHEKTPYELWLEAGNTGTYQDYLDSLVAPTPEMANKTQMYYAYPYLEGDDNYINLQGQDMPWTKHGGYALYTYKQHRIDEYNNIDADVTQNEKDLALGEYGVKLRHGVLSKVSPSERTEITPYYYFKEDGVDRPVYIPSNNNPYSYAVTDGTVFSGSTMAYVVSALDERGPSAQTAEFIKGDATLVYNKVNYQAQPELTLDFENYYTIVFKPNVSVGDFVTVSGENNTGNPNYDIAPGEYKKGYEITRPNLEQGFAKVGDTEEVFGKYKFEPDSSYRLNGSVVPNANGVSVTGAFGGTKQ